MSKALNYIFNFFVEMPWYVYVNMLEGPWEEKHCAYRATFFKDFTYLLT